MLSSQERKKRKIAPPPPPISDAEVVDKIITSDLCIDIYHDKAKAS